MAGEVFLDGRLRIIHRNPPGNAGGIDLRSQTDMVDGKWHHFAVVRGNDNKLHVYIDGELEASSEEEAANFDDTPNQAFLGMNVEKSPRYFRGLMDEIRFWNVARTKEEINSSLNSRMDLAAQGLVAGFNFTPSDSVLAPNQELGRNLYLPPVVRESLSLPPVSESP